jgi:hypothetical protein
MSRADVAYLRRLDDELRGLPRARREEILTEVREHINEADPVGEAELREVLDRLGDPEDIAAEARERFGVADKGMGTQEVAAVVLLTIGGLLLPLIGWLAGAVLMWGSRAWNTRDKWIGTLLFPGGITFPYLVLAGVIGGYSCYEGDNGEICQGEPSDLERAAVLALVLLAVLGTIFSGIYLSRRARRGAY